MHLIPAFLGLLVIVLQVFGQGDFAYYCSNIFLAEGTQLQATCESQTAPPSMTTWMDLNYCYSNVNAQLVVSIHDIISILSF
jgi:hypothetical protein